MSEPRQTRPRRRPGRIRRGGLVLVAVAALTLAALPAAADWLVTRDGGRVETDGAWEVKGRLVVFNSADGTLSSMRLDQVDLEASRQATRRAEEAASRPAAAPAPAADREAEKPRRRITTADVGRGAYRPPAEEPGEGEAEDAEAAPEGEAISTQLVVLSSQEEETFDGHVRISGSLANQGETTVLGAGLTVFLQDVEGEPAAEAEAELSQGGLTPGQVVTFSVDFPEVFAYTSLAFRPSGTRVATGGDDATAGDDGGDDSDLSSPDFEPEASDDDLYEPEPFDGDEG